MLDFWIKDMKLLWRDRTELLVIFLMPFILMTILGFALKGIMGEEAQVFDMTVALVEEDNQEEAAALFVEELEGKMLPPVAVTAMTQAAEQLRPNQILQQILKEDLDFVTVREMDASEAEKQLAAQEVEAVLIIPENFTYNLLNHILLDQSVERSTLHIIKGEHAHFDGDILQNIIEQFTQSMNLETAIVKATGANEVPKVHLDIENIAEEETITNRDPITSIEYYTIGMAVMFAFFVASTMAAKTYTEHSQLVLDRIILSGKHPVFFLLGKFLAVILMAFIQILILFGLSSLIMQSFQPFTWKISLTVISITFLYAIAVGAIGSLLVAMTIRFHSNSVSGAFSGGLVSVMALLGGSFTPITTFPDIIQTIGSWTPNGMTLRAYMLANQGMPLTDILPYMYRLLIIAVIIFIVSIMVFPARRTES
ncbi:ABC-2 type transport system permease protein [Gracilibacillus ureilyticus]|uniref:ABC-2 type transport system permease protein n=1 Tax=Gracilibacillus ureilyticus TaxID=531814 RepID=A0A1H9MWL6_9BACI|nr:ABC transporter permease [Gracilibacillus ureilyticus]SER27493.1 ABC-2 type transport system permease protein [Gracilibacillus ureilyticus]